MNKKPLYKEKTNILMNKVSLFVLALFILSLPVGLASDNLTFSEEQSLRDLNLKGISPEHFVTLGDTKELDFSLDTSDCKLYKIKNFDYVKVSDLKPSTAPGEPQLPMKTFVVKLPLNSTVSDVNITSGEFVKIKNKLNIAPTPEPLKWHQGVQQKIEYNPDEDVYSSEENFTGNALSYEVGKDNHNTYVYVRLYPLQYSPKKKKAILITKANIKVYYSEGENFFYSSQNSYQSSSDGSEAIIITPPEFYNQSLELADFHEQQNESINTTVINTTWIYANYNNTIDPPIEGCADGCEDLISKGYNYTLAKRIIAFLKNETTTNQNLKYVTLFGNTLYVPPSYYVDNYIVTDFFYSSPDYDATDIDPTPNYMVGRLPVDNETEAEHVVQKIINWRGNLSEEWFNNSVVAGGKPFGTSLYMGELIITDAINKGYFNGMNITKQFRTDNNFNKQNMSDTLSSGNTGFIYHIGHGGGNGMELKRGPENRIYVEDVMNYSENPNTSILVSIACSNGQYDIDIFGGIYGDYNKSFAEGVLLSKAGSVAYIGGARTNYGYVDSYLDKGYLIPIKEYWMAGMLTNVFKAYSEGGSTLGNITTEAMKSYYENNTITGIDKLTFFEFTLLGDPALKIPAKGEGKSYQQPNLTAVSPDFYENITWGMETPIYNLDTGESVTVNSETNSSIETKLINTKKWENETINRTQNQFDYTFVPPENSLYLIRTISDDEKEGWLYTYTQFVPENANLYLSTPTTVREGDQVWIHGEVEPNLAMNFSATLIFPNGSQEDLGSINSNQYGWFYFNFGTQGYSSGEYKVIVQGQLEDLSLEGTVKFKILDYDELEILPLTSKKFNTTKCKQYNFSECKIWPIKTTGIIDNDTCQPNNCDILEISKSGEVHNATIDTPDGLRHIAVVDTNYPNTYDMVFIDDDSVFMQTSGQEFNISEKGFLTEGSIAGDIETKEGEKIDIKIAKIARNGSSILLITPPARDEIPYDRDDEVNFVVLALDSGNPKEGISVYPEYHYQGNYPYVYSQLSNSTTDEFGLSSSYSFPVYKTGIYRIDVNEEWSTTIKVRPPFDTKYSIKDVDTEKEKSFFKRGDKIKFEVSAKDRQSGSLISLKKVYLKLRDPEGNLYSVSMDDTTDSDYVYEGTYTLGENAPTGKWSVNIEVESEEGIRDYVRTSFEVKSFEVKTSSQERFAPNESAWVLVTAVELGSGGDYYKMPEFYPIDDPNTTEIDECSKDELGNYRNVIINSVKDKEGNKLDISSWNITNVETFLEEPPYNSKYFQEFEQHTTELPDSFLRQCVIQFNAPVKQSVYSGDLNVKRANVDERETGSFMFSVQVIDAWAYPWDPDEGWKWASSPGSNVTLKLNAYDLYNQKRIPISDIIDAKITEIRGEQGVVDILNQSFVKNLNTSNSYALLNFIAPNQTGWYNVKFMLTAQINESGTLKNETGLGRGWFSVRLYDVWGWTEKRRYSTNDSVPINVTVRDFSGNPVSNINIEIEEVTNRKTREDYTDKIIWGSSKTNSNGKATITLEPNRTWKKGRYSVKLKAIDSEGRYEYGRAGFEVKNYRVSVKRLVNGDQKWKILKGDNLTFIPLVWKVSQGWDEPPLNSSHYSINLDESVLNYYGSGWSRRYEPEKIKFTELNATPWNKTYEGINFRAVNISTNNSLIKSGNYEASIKLNIDGEEEIGESWLNIRAFEPDAKVLQRVYGQGDEASINVSVTPEQEFNVTLKELEGGYRYEYSEVDINATTLECNNSCLYNFSLPTDIKEGWYHGTLKFSIGEDVEYERIWFDVKSLELTPPKSVRENLWEKLTNKTYIHSYVYPTSPCSEIGYNLTLPPEIVNDSCSLLNSTLTQSRNIGIPRNDYLILIDKDTNKIYIDTNSDFTDGNITYNSTINDTFTDAEGIEWVIKEINYYGLELEAKNALNNGIKVNLSLSKSGEFRFGRFNESRFGGYWSKEEKIDLNNNGKQENIYLLAVDTQESGAYDEIFVEYNVTDLSDKNLTSVGSTTDLGTPIYIIELTKTTYGNLRAYLAIPEAGNHYPWFGTRRTNTNITFPVLLTYPNGTAIQGANVSIYKVILRNLETEELEDSTIKLTDKNGIAIFTYNLTNSGDYTIIPEAQVEDKQTIMKRWTSPHVEAKAFRTWSDTYSKLAELSDFEEQTPTKLETIRFPRQGREVYLKRNNSDVTPPDGVIDYYADYTEMDEDKWWFLIDNNTERIYVDNDALFNESDDSEMQEINISDDFWLNWTESGYNLTFKLLSRPDKDRIVFGFELGKYKGRSLNLSGNSNITINNKQYKFILNNITSENQANLTVIDFKNNSRTRIVSEGNWKLFYPLNIYVENITLDNIDISISTGDLEIANYTDNNLVVLDNTTYPNGFDLSRWSGVSYDTVLISTTGNATELHPGDEWLNTGEYVSAISRRGDNIILLNGTKVLYPPETGSDYLVKHINETSLGSNGTDLNEDGDLGDEFYFVIYDSPWDDVTEYTRMIVDDDNDLLYSWLPVDFKGNETGVREDITSLPSDYVWTLGSSIFFNNQTNNLTLLEDKWRFEQEENITVWVEANDFDGSAIKGNLSIIKIKTWEQEFNASEKLKTELVDGYGLITVAPQNFKNETTNRTKWPSDFRIIGNITSTDGREEIITIWSDTGTSSVGTSGGGLVGTSSVGTSGGGAGVSPESSYKVTQTKTFEVGRK